MNIFTLIFLFFFSTLTVLAQDTIVYNDQGNKVELSDPSACYDVIQDSYPKKGIDSISRKYKLNGAISSEITFNSKKGKRVFEGSHKYWYESGKPFYTADYKNGELNGKLVAFHENGKLRRKDIFKNGELKSGEVWDENGTKIEYFPHFKPATFPGGNQNLGNYLRENIITPPNNSDQKTFKVIVRFMIDTTGKIAEHKIMKSPENKQFEKEALRILYKMPNWNPGESFGEKIRVWYALPITFGY